MKRSVITITAAAGVAFATPAFGREPERPPDCPIMPTTNDVEQSRSGGLSLQVGGFGVGANRARTRAETDVMMRFGSFADWSAAAVLSQACQMNRRLYPNDPRRQRDEFIALRDRLLGQRAGTPAPAAPASRPRPIDNPTGATSRGSETAGWTFAQMWQPVATYTFMPSAALSAGLREGAARVDCRVSQARGVDDCYLISETPSGYGFGNAVARYLRALRLKPELLGFTWPERRVQLNIRLTTWM